MFRLWILVIAMTVISWFVLKLINKPTHIGLVFLFWVVAIMGTTLLLYLVSVWFTSHA
ncbi:hypothetical protein QCB45_07065 [Thiomicrorhabdus sp. ZW0627]|uniref:hypothetical protein n=1 Tax=Thiomicrorhabdus sp. ZW0627 TaxID=3039774 RepID=UPI00243648D4|nr:hypothetical protein [Thiomicrorhabdus sp. ZW0627]MDG6774087.1 hypothetical protein [Thiomicrorhabdus sp. ZW0627]